jgi:hypothetical protein
MGVQGDLFGALQNLGKNADTSLIAESATKFEVEE